MGVGVIDLCVCLSVCGLVGKRGVIYMCVRMHAIPEAFNIFQS